MGNFGIAPPGLTSRGGAFDYTSRFLGGLVNELESYPALTVASSQVVGQNADRVGLIIQNIGNNGCFLSTVQPASITSGIFLTPQGGFLTLNVTEDFTLCARAWFAVTSVSTSQLYVLEIIRILQPSQVTNI